MSKHPRFRNYYECPVCHHLWDNKWDATCDDTCPVCGARNISPYESEDYVMYQLRWEVIDETNPNMETILAVYPIAEFEHEDAAYLTQCFFEAVAGARCVGQHPNAKLRIVEVWT